MSILAVRAKSKRLSRREPKEPESASFFVLDNVTWEFYEKLLREPFAQRLRVTYDQGKLVLMAPISLEHEMPKRFLGRIIETLTLELNIPIRSAGSITCKRKDLARGMEADECYFIQHEAQLRNRKKWNARHDPPPDLAIEVDITHFPVQRDAIYAALGIPELWHYKSRRVRFLKLESDRQYHIVDKSIAFPMLTVDNVNSFLQLSRKTDETSAIRAFRDWVRKQ
jgi:Uma2 family endonuclease